MKLHLEVNGVHVPLRIAKRYQKAIMYAMEDGNQIKVSVDPEDGDPYVWERFLVSGCDVVDH